METQKWTEQRVLDEEMNNVGTSWTRNKFFDDNGYLILKKWEISVLEILLEVIL